MLLTTYFYFGFNWVLRGYFRRNRGSTWKEKSARWRGDSLKEEDSSVICEYVIPFLTMNALYFILSQTSDMKMTFEEELEIEVEGRKCLKLINEVFKTCWSKLKLCAFLRI